MTHDQIVIEAQQRKLTGKKVAQLRRNGILPGVLYGRHLEKPIAIQMDYHTTSLLAQKLTSTTLVTLNLDEKKYNAIVRDRQRDVIFGRLTHLDFLAVVMDEVLRAAVSIELVGEAPVLKAVDAVITQAVNSLELEALPADLPERIEVDISGLETPDDVITVKDLKLGDKVTVLTDPDEVIVSVTFAAQEVEPEEAATGEEPEVMEKGKKEEEA